MSRAVLLSALSCAAALAGGPEWVKMPAGSFVMGCEPSRACPELQAPRRVVFERPFWMHKTEVTVGHFREFVKATGYTTETEWASTKTANLTSRYQLSPAWAFEYSASLDLTRHSVQTQRFVLSRDLRCWQAVFTRMFMAGGEAEYYFRN
ncbi:MAG: SUMF1/EgtB/PvdO family nonheme iron enzyme, partial [Acidobacteria bacterium]|nr:SUMF1/EgtB/PvdO family nonheme iron enzyme [Acidobacteriota bacterium]